MRCGPTSEGLGSRSRRTRTTRRPSSGPLNRRRSSAPMAYGKVPGSSPQGNAQRLGMTLWAQGLETADERAFFDLLCVVAREPQDPAEASAQVSTSTQTRSEERAERRKERAKISQLESDVRDLKKDRRKQSEAVKRAEDQRTKLGEQLSEVERELHSLRAEADQVRRDLWAARAELDVAQRELTRTADAADEARKGAKEARARREEVEQARSRAVRELSLRRRRDRGASGAIGRFPTGKEAVHAFLQEEERRIDDGLDDSSRRRPSARAREHASREKLEAAFKAAYPEFVPPRPVLRAEPAPLQLTPLGGADEIGTKRVLPTNWRLLDARRLRNQDRRA